MNKIFVQIKKKKKEKKGREEEGKRTVRVETKQGDDTIVAPQRIFHLFSFASNEACSYLC